jgi:hypothetical protein
MVSGPHVSHRDWVVQNPEMVLRIIVGIYLVLGALYAVFTPAWQVPDEPAHYNYVRYVAENLQLPVLQSGDLPSIYLEELLDRRFPPEMSIAPLRYESYEPPLYHILAAVAYRAMGPLGVPMPLGLRAFSLLLGLGALVIGYRLVLAIYPNDPLPALGTAAFAATLPMHLAITAAVNNAALVELMLSLTVWRLVTMGHEGWNARQSFVLGALLGLALLSGVSAYLAPGVALIALAWDSIHTRHDGKVFFLWRILGYGAIMFGTALMIALPWFLHNIQVYNLADPLGLSRYNQVASAQSATSEYIAEHGWLIWLRDMVVITFCSFWGQFGWMSVLLDYRIYLSLALASGLTMMHLALYVWDMVRGKVHVAPHTARALVLLFVWGAFTVLGYFWHNMRFVQFQGRHLFPALAVWGLGCTVGLRKLFQYSPLPTLALLATSIVALFAFSIATGDYRGFGITAVALTIVIIGVGHWLQSRAHSTPLALTYLSLAILALVCLFGYIVPALS